MRPPLMRLPRRLPLQVLQIVLSQTHGAPALRQLRPDERKQVLRVGGGLDVVGAVLVHQIEGTLRNAGKVVDIRRRVVKGLFLSHGMDLLFLAAVGHDCRDSMPHFERFGRVVSRGKICYNQFSERACAEETEVCMANFTKQAIETAFLQLLNEKPLNKISVRDIVEKCGINRNSFYYHFQDIPSLIAEIITSYTDQLIEEYPTISTLDECCEMAFRYALQNRSAVMHIYHSVNRDLFEESTMRLCEYAVTTYIDTAFPQHQLPEADRRAVIRFIKCQLFGMCIDWISGGMQDEALEELRRISRLCHGLPELIIERSREDH